MNKNLNIEIMQVDNGFVVRPVRESYEAHTNKMEVFVTMGKLTTFLRQHFDHRGVNETQVRGKE